MLALTALICTTRFSDLLAGLRKLGLPKILIVQLGFLYRYIFVFIDKAQHILRARSARSLRNLGIKTELKTAGCMVGSLLVRSIGAAERISIAMQGRGFDGNWRSFSRMQIRLSDYIFAAAAAVFIFGVYIFVKPVLP
jgi:cobalt/nickel transport system permease protein